MKKLLALLPVIAILAISGCVSQPSELGNGEESGAMPYNIFQSRESLSNTYHTIIDRSNPTYILGKKTDCASHDGAWFDQSDRIGCFDIRVPYDSSVCNNDALIQMLEGICDTVIGARWACDTRQIGCYYP